MREALEDEDEEEGRESTESSVAGRYYRGELVLVVVAPRLDSEPLCGSIIMRR